MDQTPRNPEAYDFRQYDRVWQRVAPNLEPYPDMTAAPAAPVPAAPAPVQTVPAPVPAGDGAQEAALPGAERNPCCMGTAASELLEVIAGYIEAALTERRCLLALAGQAPSWARRALRDIAGDLQSHARRLMAAHYLITGRCYRPAAAGERIYLGRWCPALRERYHAAACAGFNYARSAGDTTDPCLARLFDSLSAASYRHAEELSRLLERSLQN